MGVAHHPEAVQMTDGRWEVRCPECSASGEPSPIGIGLPLADEHEAVNIRNDHRSRVVGPV